MDNHNSKTNEDLNRNYEIFEKNYEISFSELLNKNIADIANKSGAEIYDKDKFLLSFFEKYVLIDLINRKISIISAKNLDDMNAGTNIKTDIYSEKSISKKSIAKKQFHNFNLKKLEELDLFSSAIILHFILTADGTPLAKEWISYRELPDGLFYASTIPGVLKPIEKKYENSGEKFIENILKFGGEKNLNFKFAGVIYPFKRFPILLILDEKDDEFEANVRVLFDRSASHYLKSDIIKTILVYTVRKLLI